MKTYTTPFIVAASLLALTVPAVADAEFNTLQSQYETAAKKALEPLQTAYVNRLKVLREKHERNGNYKEAEIVKQEMDKISALAETSDSELAGKVNGKTLRNTSGIEITFKKDGTGTKNMRGDMIPMRWFVEGELIRVDGPLKTGGDPVNMWFKPTEKRGEFLQGNTITDIRWPFSVK